MSALAISSKPVSISEFKIITDKYSNYNKFDEIIDILIQKLLSAGFSRDDIENMLTGNMIKFITRNKH